MSLTDTSTIGVTSEIYVLALRYQTEALTLRARLKHIIRFCEERLAKYDEPGLDDFYAGQAVGYKEACDDILSLAVDKTGRPE